MTGAGGAKARKALSQRAILQLIGSSPILGQIGYLDAADSKTKSLGSRTLTDVRKPINDKYSVKLLQNYMSTA